MSRSAKRSELADVLASLREEEGGGGVLRSVQAAQKSRAANRARSLSIGGGGGLWENVSQERLADIYAREANELLAMEAPRDIGSGREVTLQSQDLAHLSTTIARGIARDTLQDPDMVAIDASTKRIDQVVTTGIGAQALDAADSIGASNSLEKMLAHQLALNHDLVMRLVVEAEETRDALTRIELLKTSDRLMRTFQGGLQTLQKIRRGGKQTVVVQHVHVRDGGQAVVAGEVGGGGG